MAYLRKGKVVTNAYQVSKSWRLGPHVFINGEDLIFRLCYFRNDTGTYYIQLHVKFRNELDSMW